jgi:hypothetical protein
MLLLDAGIIRQPIWGHLKDLHMAIKLCEEALIATDINISWSKSRVKRAISSFDHNFLFIFGLCFKLFSDMNAFFYIS